MDVMWYGEGALKHLSFTGTMGGRSLDGQSYLNIHFPVSLTVGKPENGWGGWHSSELPDHPAKGPFISRFYIIIIISTITRLLKL